MYLIVTTNHGKQAQLSSEKTRSRTKAKAKSKAKTKVKTKTKSMPRSNNVNGLDLDIVPIAVPQGKLHRYCSILSVTERFFFRINKN